MSSKHAAITVGIPFYNGDNRNHFRQALKSVQEQTCPPETIHLIQDGPVSDALASVAREAKSSDQRVKHIRIDENKGLSSALNTSILEADTPLYARMDADDLCHRRRLEQQIQHLKKFPNVDILGTAALEFENDPRGNRRSLKVMPQQKEEIKKMMHYRTPFIHPTIIFRRRVFSQIGLYRGPESCEDVDLWMRAVKRDVDMANLPQPLLYYRRDGVIGRRAKFSRAIREAAIRLGYPTSSPKLNFLKLASIVFRLLPVSVQAWGYRYLRQYL
jgi:glycosyltransferase involved in cell wall biosynthesis